MAGNVKGITVEIGGNTTKLGKALTQSEKQSRTLQKELKSINTALKFNPNSVELLTQKQKVLTEQIEATKEKLNALKEVESQVEAQFNAGEIGEEQFREFQREIIETESKLKTYQAQLEATGQKASELDQLTTAISDQERKVEDLKTEWKNAVLTYGENSEEAQKLAKEIDQLSNELKENKDKMTELDRAADKLDNSIEDVDDSTEKANSGFSAMQVAIGNLVSQAIQSAINALRDLGQAAIDAYNEFDEGYDNLIKATGATGEAAEGLAKSYANTAKSVVGDMGTIGSAVGEVNTRFGYTGKQLEQTSEDFLKFADITGTDATEAVRLVSRAMGDAGIDASEYSTLLDQLAVAGQASGVSIDKLTESVAKYGAPMRALGFDTKESIALFAQWEKTGVNTEIAFSGMKKAISNWSKEGKDARVEFKKTLDEIEATPDIASATTKAIEVFGAKAGPDLADAIKGGRFEYSEFLDLLEGSTGTVEKTYSQTQSGADKIKLAIQGARVEMGSTVQKLSEKYYPQIKDAISKASDLFKKFADSATKAFIYITDHSKEIISVLKAIGTVIATVFVTNKIATFVNSLKTLGSGLIQVATKIGLVKGATDAATASTGLLAAAQAALPFVALAAGVAAVTAAVVIYNKKQEEAIRAEYALTDAQKETIATVKESAEAYEELDNARNEAVSNISAEYGYINELKDEYNGLIDSNGKVKKGYEDRANFIINQLAEALGVERSEIEKTIGANGQLGESIDQIIQKKQAEATLAANEEAYTTAIQNRGKALQELQSAQKVADEAEAKYTETKKKAADSVETYNKLLKESPLQAKAYYDAHKDILSANDEAEKSYKEAKAALKDAENTYVGYNATIQNYEGLSAAIISGDTAKIAEALVNLQNNFITAENGTKTSLENQVKTFKDQYAAMKQAVADGMPGVTQDQVDAMADLVAKAEEELNKLPPEAKKSGEKTGKEHAAGVASTSEDNKKSGEKVSSKTDEGLNKSNTKSTGKKKGSEYKSGVEETAESGKKAGEKVSSSTNTGLGSADTNSTGKSKGSQFATGLNSTGGSANTAGKGLSLNASKGAGSVSLSGTGEKTGGTFVTGLGKKESSSKTKGENLAKKAKTGAGSVSAYSSGENLGQGFINGIGSKFKGAFDKAVALAKKALAGIKEGQKEGSPSKLTYQSGLFFDEGYINAIKDKTGEAVKAAQDMAKKTVEALGVTNISDAIIGDTSFNGLTFGRQLDNTFNLKTSAPDLSTILTKLDAISNAIINNSDKQIVLDTGVLVGETLNQIDNGLANTYALKARGV